VGWFVLDVLVPSDAWVRGDGPYLEAHLAYSETTCVLLRPLTFVNLSGEAAVRVCERYEIDLPELLVVVDDVHLALGDMRLRKRGSAGGHNGLISLEQSLGSQEVPRLRIGIGAPEKTSALVHHVLTPFAAEEEPVVRECVTAAAVIVRAFGEAGFGEATAAYSRWKAESVAKPSSESNDLTSGANDQEQPSNS
jgi:PTH1 family peptidyl-tRNA hydrolase